MSSWYGLIKGGNVNILIVDNDATYRKVLGEYLGMCGNFILSADDGATALRALEHEKIDLIISDIHMSHVSGVELHRRVRRNPRTAHIPFVFVSGYPDLRGSSIIQNPKIDHVMSKLSSAAEISSVVRNHALKAPVLRQSTPLTGVT